MKFSRDLELDDELDILLKKHKIFEGKVVIVISVILIVTIFLMVFRSFDHDQLGGIIVPVLFICSFPLLMLIGGIRLIKNNYYELTEEQQLTRRKKRIRFYSILILIILLIGFYYKSNELITEVNIDYNTEYQFIYNGNLRKYSIDLNYIRLSCSMEFEERLTSDVLNHHGLKNTYIIEYQWNKLFPDYGKIISYRIE